MGWNYLLSFNDVSMGDALRIEIDAATGHVFMIGPAVEVLQGEIALADRERSFNKMQIRTAVPTGKVTKASIAQAALLCHGKTKQPPRPA